MASKASPGLYLEAASREVQRAEVSLQRRIASVAFWSYLGVATCAIAFSAWQSRRFVQSVARLRTCAAEQDSACTGKALEIARAIREGDSHVRVGDGFLAVLLHDLDRGRSIAAEVEVAQKQRGTAAMDLRADLLLLQGDIALASFDRATARERYVAAQALLGSDRLTDARLRRVDALDQTEGQRTSNELDSLRHEFEALFHAAASGNCDVTELHQSAVNQWTNRVADGTIRGQLTLAARAASRACQPIADQQRSSAYAPPAREAPRPPSRGGYDYGMGSYEERMRLYRERLARFEKEQADALERQQDRQVKAATTRDDALTQAKDLLAAALAALATQPAPFQGGAPGVSTPRMPGVPRAVPATGWE